jgi:hypothetical protein
MSAAIHAHLRRDIILEVISFSNQKLLVLD